MSEDPTPEAPGWAAIDRALAPHYGAQAPRHWGTVLSHRLGGPDPLDGISAYRRDDPVPHWHYVSYGFSELYDKESDEAGVSGWGFELTFRLRCDPSDDEPPRWPVNFLQNLARYVFKSGRTFAVGDHMNLNGPIALGEETAIRAVLFAADPELGAIDTPNGRLEFVQIVGITLDEELAGKQWNPAGLLGVLQAYLPLLVTDLRRESAMSTPEVRAAVDRGAAQEGSSTGAFLVDRLDWTLLDRSPRKPELRVTMGAKAVGNVAAVLPGRARFGRTFALVGQGCAVEISASESTQRHSTQARTLHLALGPEAIDALCAALAPRTGLYPVTELDEAELVVEIVKTEIRDADGTVVETIG